VCFCLLFFAFFCLNWIGTFGILRNDHKDSKFYEFAMQQVLGSVQIPFSLAIIFCYINADPFSFILPTSRSVFVIVINICFRVAFSCLAGYFRWLPVAFILLFSLVYLRMLKKTSVCLMKWTEVQLSDDHKAHNTEPPAAIEIKTRTQQSQKYLRKISIRSIFKMHIRTRKMLEAANEAFYYLFPSLFLFGVIIFVLSNYATIKMHSTIPMPFYLVMPSMSIFAAIMISILFPNASDVHESSVEFLRSVKLIVGRRKYWRKVWRAEKPLAITAGPFFFAKRSTKTTYFYQCIDFTITGLMITYFQKLKTNCSSYYQS
jgi:hypothetical protein